MKDSRRDLRSFRSRASALKRKAQKHGLVCHLCGRPFDWTLPYFDGGAFTADHVTPIDRGGHINGPLLPAHRSCNSSKGNGARVETMPTTRSW